MATPLDQARAALGELFITGFSGPELAEETAAFLSKERIGGVMIGASNYESPAQLAERDVAEFLAAEAADAGDDEEAQRAELLGGRDREAAPAAASH